MTPQFDGRIPLAAMVQALRSELYEAVAQSQAETIRFGIEKLDVELSIEVSRTTEGKGGIKFWVVSADAGIKSESTSTHKVHISLSPVDPSHNPITISSSTSAEPK